MATTETNKHNERELNEGLLKKAIDTASIKLPPTERLDESPNPSSRSSLQPSIENPASDEPQKESGETKEIESRSVEASLGSSDAAVPVSDLQKKIRRAERFGVSVQMSEQEKRNSRAERFGAGFTSQGSDELKKSEEQKRKDRAERFGLPAQSMTDEEAKKKARIARFATHSKNDTIEEDKKKARAIRFSQPPSSAPLQLNDKANSEQKRTIVGEASGGA